MLNIILHDVSNCEDLEVEVSVLDGETMPRQPVDLTGHEIVLQASPAGHGAHGPTLTASNAANDGSLTILPPPTMGVFQVCFTAAQMSRCAPINYNLGAKITFEGKTAQLAVGVFNVVEGFVR